MTNPFTNCPPLPSQTQIQTLSIGTTSQVLTSGQLVLAVGGATLGPLNAVSLIYDLQNALSANFPGSVVMGNVTGGTIQALLTIYFVPDPSIAITQVSSTLKDAGGNPINITIGANPGVLYPNYNWLTTRWPEFLLPGNPTSAQLQTAELQLLGLKQDAFAYVQPKNWDAWRQVPGGNTPFVQGVFLMIAHLKKLGKDPVGFVTEQQANKLRESYSDDKFLAGTVYGQQFIRLRDSIVVTMRFIGPGGGGRILGWQQGGFEGPQRDYPNE